MNSLSPRHRLIVALDYPTSAEALRMVEQLSGEIETFKIGLQLYTAAGPKVVLAVMETGAKIFLDLKLHDIPNTVAGAVAAASALGVQMLTVHLSGGRAMLEAAVASRTPDLSLLGVTVLTSTEETTLRETGISSSIDEQVQRLAELGVTVGIDGVIASPHEIKTLRARFGHKLTIVSPGIRPSWAQPGDQKRFTTPKEALQNGADYVVIGRPITAHPDPREAVQRILEEISA
jgi:orotidine-5'-phosphate decarboxylase